MDKAARADEDAAASIAPRATWAARSTTCSRNPAVTGDEVGVVGFCMGGMLALVLAAQQGDKIAAAAPFYGAPLGDSAPDWSNLTAPVRGHFAENDDFFPADAIRDARDGAARARQGRGVRGAAGDRPRVRERGERVRHVRRRGGRQGARPRHRVPARTARLIAPRLSRSAERASIAGGISSRPAASSWARSMLIASRGSRSGQLSHGPGGIVPATQCRRYCCSSRTSRLAADRTVAGHDRVARARRPRRARRPTSRGRPGTRAASRRRSRGRPRTARRRRRRAPSRRRRCDRRPAAPRCAA